MNKKAGSYLYKGSSISRHINNSDIEIFIDVQPTVKIKHAILDHDGTISTLRQGWEEIMEKVMIDVITGGRDRHSSGCDLYNKIRGHVTDYINQSTGIQTILQMEALVEMVRNYGLVPENKVLDKFGYKKIYNREILKLVNKRISKLKSGEMNADDFKIKGVEKLLYLLRGKKVKLYLASGTDHEDVVNEAKILGYLDLFEGRVYGSLNDLSKFSKKMIIEDVMKKNKLNGPELMVVGDGPIEIRECREVDGIAVGVASNEINGIKVNQKKRIRLIENGAHVIVPNYLQADKLVDYLFKYK